MAKYLGIPLTVSNGNKTPLTAQPELVTNGDFKDGTNGWTASAAGSTFTVGTHQGRSDVADIGITDTNITSRVTQSFDFVKGKAYSFSIDVYLVSGSFRADTIVSVYAPDFVATTTTGVWQTLTAKFVAESTQTADIFLRSANQVSEFYVDSVSVKEIAATETPTYGSPELVTNGDFTTSQPPALDWSGTNWTVSGNGKAVHATTNNDKLIQSMGLVSGKKYAIQWTVTDYSSGTLGVSAASGTKSGDDAVSANGTYNTVLVSNGAAFQIYASGVSSLSSVSVKEVPYVEAYDLVNKPYTQYFSLQENWSANDSSLYFEGNGSSPRYAASKVNLEFGKTYRVKFDILNKTLSGTVNAGLSNTGYFSGVPASERVTTSTGNTSFDFVAVLEDVAGKEDEIRFVGQNVDTFTIVNFSVTEVQYNYLQVADGGFTKSVKEGDVIFNTSTSTEGVVKDVVDNNVLLMSNDNFSTAGEFFNVFAANGDTRGNQIIRTDNYIMSEYDEDPSNPQESSFWYAGGVDADKVSLTHLVPATNTFFVADLIESYTERLNNQSATASRLDIPLDAFRDHKNNEVLATTSITLS